CEVDEALQKSVERVLERFFAKSNEAEATVFKMRHRMTEPFFEIAQDKEADAQLIADLDHILVCLRKNREPEKDHLIDSMLANDLVELLRAAEQRQVGVVNLFVI